MDPFINFKGVVQSILDNKEAQNISFEGRSGRFQQLKSETQPNLSRSVAQALEYLDRQISEIRTLGLTRKEKKEIQMIKDRSIEALEIINKWSEIHPKDGPALDKLALQLIRKVNSLNDVEEFKAGSIRAKFLPKITPGQAKKIADDANKVRQYVEANKDKLFVEAVSGSTVLPKEKTKLPATVLLMLPDKESARAEDMIVLLLPKPDKAINYKNRKRMVIPIGRGGFKLIKLAAGFRLTGDPKLTYYASATPRGFDAKMKFSADRWESASRKLLGEMMILEQIGGKRGIIDALKPHFIYPVKPGKRMEGTDKPNMILVYAESDLESILEKGAVADKEKRQKWTLDLLAGLETIHEGVKDEISQVRILMHNDLKPENIFIVDGEVKIGDFGLSIYVEEKAKEEKLGGSLLYFSPEKHAALARKIRRQSFTKEGMISQKTEMDYDSALREIGTQSDVFAMGLILFQMKHGSLTGFMNRMQQEYIQGRLTSAKAQRYIRDWYNSYEPSDREDLLIKEMINPDPKQRLSAKGAYEKLAGLYTG